MTIKEFIAKLSIVPEDSQITFSFNIDERSMDVGFLRVDKIDEHQPTHFTNFMKGNTMDNIKKTKLLVQARCGMRITNCLREAMLLSIEERVDVELTHNNYIYTVTKNKKE